MWKLTSVASEGAGEGWFSSQDVRFIALYCLSRFVSFFFFEVFLSWKHLLGLTIPMLEGEQQRGPRDNPAKA